MARHIVISANGYHDLGGLFHLVDGAFTPIDALPSGGLAQRDGTFYRMTHTRSSEGAELLTYDKTGIIRYNRIDAIGNPHDVLCMDDGSLYCVAAHTNSVVRIFRDGSIETIWAANAATDSWHVNCLTLHEGRLLATAFGAFDKEMGWREGCTATGFLFDVLSGERIVEGLTMPHTPRFIDGAWTVCDSGTQAFLRVNADGTRERVELGGFVRGTLVDGDVIYVGCGLDGSAKRTTEHKGYVAVLDRATLRVTGEIKTSVNSVYDIVSVDTETLEGLQTGFRFGSIRDSVFGQLAMFEQVGVTPKRVWATGEKLFVDDVRARITMDFPERVDAGTVTKVRCKVKNDGAGIFVTALPHPVYLCYRWFDADDATVGEGTWVHTELLRILQPKQEHAIDADVRAPETPGVFTLRMTLLQENAWWFDDVDIANAAIFTVTVGRAP